LKYQLLQRSKVTQIIEALGKMPCNKQNKIELAARIDGVLSDGGNQEVMSWFA
jgi:hypothetical protein